MPNFPIRWKTDIQSGYLGAGASEVEAETGRIVTHDGLTNGGVTMMAASMKGSLNVETLAANKVLGPLDEIIQALDAGGANRDIELPAAAGSYYWKIKNSGGANDLVVKDDGGATIATITPGNTEEFYSDQTNWNTL